jgi:hypothetical protein
MVAHTGFLTTARRLDLAEPTVSAWEVGEESE